MSPLVTAAEAAVELPAESFPQLINITKYGRMSLISANFVLSTAPTPSYQIYILMEQDNPKIAQKDNFNDTNNASKYDKILFLERSYTTSSAMTCILMDVMVL